MDSTLTPSTPSREERFVAAAIQRCQNDKGLAARLRRADNPATEYQSWDFLGTHGVDLEREYERLPFATVAAAIARFAPTANGTLTLGRAIAACYEDGNQSDQAVARLRRVLACGDLVELCRIVRSVLRLIESRVVQPLDFIRLLRQLRRFGYAASQGDGERLQRIKAQWAQEFYGYRASTEKEAA